MNNRASLFLIAALLAATSAPLAAQDAVTRLTGSAYDLESGRLLYSEAHEYHGPPGQWTTGSTTYRTADGAELGRKTLDFTADAFVPVYRLELIQEGFIESITQSSGPIVMSRREGTGQDTETESVRKDGVMAADAGLPRLLAANFNALLRGEVLKFRMVVPGHLETFKFRARQLAGDGPIQIEVKMDSMLNLLAGPLLFRFDPATRRLIEYRGTSNVRDPATGKAYVVRIAYSATAAEKVP